MKFSFFVFLLIMKCRKADLVIGNSAISRERPRKLFRNVSVATITFYKILE